MIDIKRRSRRGDWPINIVVQIGLAMCMASSIAFHIRLFQLNRHLRERYPKIWRVVGTGNEELGFVAQYNRMTQLSTRYEVSDEALNSKLTALRRLHQSAGIGATALIAGVLMELLVA